MIPIKCPEEKYEAFMIMEENFNLKIIKEETKEANNDAMNQQQKDWINDKENSKQFLDKK